MLIIASSEMPHKARKRLEAEGDVLWISPQSGVYPSIATHPDIFFCLVGDTLVASPGIPLIWSDLILSKGIQMVFGRKVPSGAYPSTACYNAVADQNFLIHNTRATDPEVIRYAGNRQQLHVAQGYTRCNLIALNKEHFISSDNGITDALIRFGASVLTVNPQGILLNGQKHGFFGGTCGIRGNELFVCGSLDCFADGEKVGAFANSCGFTITELCGGSLTDVGSIIFVESSMYGETYPQLGIRNPEPATRNPQPATRTKAKEPRKEQESRTKKPG
jgi:hypothetical protein